ncbi:hypothetical protein WICMUC_004499 [Wickerhamomyces mucosus]|uniref:ADF-H domain-containing protein n=1 Tax=Wickerhamomyces mucosus TaxID=1378264 RepID=A0A9P8PHN6_9ASCO|nr:hypothetical protein WICMUC_004499 [Wickerhamomyces mucosus]
MSAQSGIIPSKNLLLKFKEFINSQSSILIANITNESIQLIEIIEGSNNLSNDFIELKSKLSESIPRYIIIKSELNNNNKNDVAVSNLDNYYTFISYVPDYSSIKEKMLYASSKTSLIKHLGSEYFNNILFLNDIDEIDYNNYKNSIGNEIDNDLNSLSNREQELQNIKNAELNTLITSSTNSKRQLITHQNQFSFKFNENIKIDFDNNILYSFNINIDKEEIYLSNQQKISQPKDLLLKISSNFPQYNLIKFQDYEFFIYSCPSGSKVKERMIYASNKQAIINYLTKINNGNSNNVLKTFEIGDPIELELSEFEIQNNNNEIINNDKTNNNLKFNRPTRPGRRTR